MDLLADKELPITGFEYTDEAGNPVAKPDGAVEEFTSDNPDVLVVVVADDGLLVARATGTLDAANLHGVSTWTDTEGATHTITGDVTINVVAGLAERATITLGEPREVTPDA